MINKLIELFKNHDTVTFKLTGLGEQSFKTVEFKEEIEVLEKQIPKKAEGEDYPYCPNCDSSSWLHNADEEENEYCGKCGQRIDWEAEE